MFLLKYITKHVRTAVVSCGVHFNHIFWWIVCILTTFLVPLVHARIRAADRWFDSCHGTFWNLTIFTLAQVCPCHGPKTINFGKTQGLISWQRTKPEKVLVSRQSLQSKIVALDLVVGFTEGPYHRLVGYNHRCESLTLPWLFFF